ncbi:Cerato-platanin-domain-containing protein [Polychytrium aggregatum]|uniref:Cerato-platanin-domain-containing protein n=1 Tax=Polychytrium aggregatum TaxID=110093 RepID=UPI0022FE353D|nr:Cerato-platanin-domain-containing protein [Polychytrium aggregatum]KAI9207301.1 Cerato-platanin-domain-containing protein [Polychytrium aggregatum]
MHSRLFLLLAIVVLVLVAHSAEASQRKAKKTTKKTTTTKPTKPTKAPAPPPPPPSGGKSLAYATYHMYTSSESLSTVACSDGSNGLMTRWGYSNLSPMWPYVMAFNGAGWNSPSCGTCIELTDTITGNTIHATVIDQCGPPPSGYSAHFDIAPPAHQELFGASASVSKGFGSATYRTVSSSNCRGNRG